MKLSNQRLNSVQIGQVVGAYPPSISLAISMCYNCEIWDITLNKSIVHNCIIDANHTALSLTFKRDARFKELAVSSPKSEILNTHI